jgi:hypothetical protein
MKSRWRIARGFTLQALMAAVLVAAAFFSTPITEHNAGFDSDGVFYAAMAGEDSFPPIAGRQAPWCYRVLTPYLASLLPFQTLTSFRVLALVSNFLSLILLGEILGALHFTLSQRVFGMLLYAGSFWTLKFSFYSPAYIDYQTQLFLMLVVYFTLRRSYCLLLLTLPIAVLQRESLAAYSVFSGISILRYDVDRPFRLRAVIALAILVVPFLALLVIRSIVEPENSYSPTVIFSHFLDALHPSFWPVMLQAVFSGMGMIPVVLAVNIRSSKRFVRRHWHWAAYGFISLSYLFGGCDKARLFLYLLPLAVILAVRSTAVLRQNTSPARFAAWTTLIIAVHLFVGGYFSPMGRFEDYLARMVPVHAGGSYLPYLIRNLLLALTLLVLTVKLVPLVDIPPNPH